VSHGQGDYRIVHRQTGVEKAIQITQRPEAISVAITHGLLKGEELGKPGRQ
jgi:hypothetical protein